ncbi:MAG: hypothetical protein SCARUB_03940 [Candidatus Scalindua rubra]|uniref:Uncharacterized protein n=1 Tax=Candidatus Scalindua rubra TaxID=1872076 RepID=A0A1E3X5U5_9BACT|nr:MAG: hypothetical protein SCARUB_03940 [Candidatus Scalindua rubra]
MSKHHRRHLTHERRICEIKTYLIIFFLCLILAIAVCFFSDRAADIDEQMAAWKLEKKETIRGGNVRKKTDEGTIIYGARLKRYDR